MKRIIMVTGGQRSGKSEFAEKLALSLSSRPTYIATSRIWDEEFKKRVERHKERRKNQWINIEEEKELSKHDVTGETVLIDCCTLWATNFFYDLKDVEKAKTAMSEELDKFTSREATYIFVTNEIGLGGVSINEMQRQFTDLQGWLNQRLAKIADDVYVMVSGISVKIK